MRSTVMILFMALTIIMGYNYQADAQRPGRRGPESVDLEAAKKKFIENRLELTPEEGDAFWPLYDQHQREMKKLADTYKKPGNPMFLSDGEAEKFLDDSMIFEEKALEERVKFLSEVRKVLPVRKVLFLRYLEDQFREEVIKRLRDRMEKGGGKQGPPKKN